MVKSDRTHKLLSALSGIYSVGKHPEESILLDEVVQGLKMCAYMCKYVSMCLGVRRQFTAQVNK